MGGVTFDLLHRIRWANVGRAAAVVLALLLALAWPRLRAHPDALPPAVEPALAVPAGAKAPRVAQPARVNEAKSTASQGAPATRVGAIAVSRSPMIAKPIGAASAPPATAAQRHAGKLHAARRHRDTRHRGARSPRLPAPAPAPTSVAPPAVVAPAAEFRP
jgi:hypothetical protein